MWILYGSHASVAHARCCFVAPPFDPLHAHVDVAHVGPDVDGEPMWDVKNLICARLGENDMSRFGQGRYHMVNDPAEGLHGHATQEELLVE